MTKPTSLQTSTVLEYTGDMNKEELYDLLLQYESPSTVELQKALDATKELVDAGEISDELADNIARLLISKHIHREMAKDLYFGKWQREHTPKRLRFLNVKYGKTHETYA